MKILQRYFATSITQAVLFVMLALLALLAFMDLTGELPLVGKGGYGITDALLYVLMLIPGHVYETMPLAALIGTIYTMAQFASSSEFTIMRASSMSTAMAAMMLFKIGVVFVLITFLFGELIAPRITPLAEKMKLSARGTTVSKEFRSGMWTKDIVKSDGLSGKVTGSRFFNVRGSARRWPAGGGQAVRIRHRAAHAFTDRGRARHLPGQQHLAPAGRFRNPL